MLGDPDEAMLFDGILPQEGGLLFWHAGGCELRASDGSEDLLKFQLTWCSAGVDTKYKIAIYFMQYIYL